MIAVLAWVHSMCVLMSPSLVCAGQTIPFNKFITESRRLFLVTPASTFGLALDAKPIFWLEDPNKCNERAQPCYYLRRIWAIRTQSVLESSGPYMTEWKDNTKYRITFTSQRTKNSDACTKATEAINMHRASDQRGSGVCRSAQGNQSLVHMYNASRDTTINAFGKTLVQQGDLLSALVVIPGAKK